MRRVGGARIVIETLGTCRDAPAPPNERLAAFYEVLEGSWGFRRQVIATDYAFDSVDHAERVMGFFFGPEMAARVRARDARVVPEWTGVWTACG
jgi:hypothetical protein